MTPVVSANRTARKPWILAACFISLIALGWLDYVTGYELGFFVFYSVPVGLAAWHSGRWPAVVTALGATLAWLLADSFGGVKYSSRFIFYWNAVIHFLAFVINAVTIAKIKDDLDQRHRLARELEASQSQLRQVIASLTSCPACGAPNEASLRQDKSDSLPTIANYTELVQALCADCRTKSGSNLHQP